MSDPEINPPTVARKPIMIGADGRVVKDTSQKAPSLVDGEPQDKVKVDPNTSTQQPFPLIKNKGGRPPGSKNLRSKESNRMLAALGFDPIKEMVLTFDDAERDLRAERRKTKPSSMAIAQLLSIKQKCINDLMRYGYARTPETVDVSATVLPPMVIQLTTKENPSGSPTQTIMQTGEDRAGENAEEDNEDIYPGFSRIEPDTEQFHPAGQHHDT